MRHCASMVTFVPSSIVIASGISWRTGKSFTSGNVSGAARVAGTTAIMTAAKEKT